MEAESLSVGSPAAAISAEVERGAGAGGTGAEDFAACDGGDFDAALRTGGSGAVLPAGVPVAMPFVLCRYMICDYRTNCTLPQVSL